MDKALRFFSDKLLVFEDNDDIQGVEVSYQMKNDKSHWSIYDQIKIVIKHFPDATPVEKILANDKILNYLSDKYNQVFQTKEYIIVGKISYFEDEHLNYDKIKIIFKNFYRSVKNMKNITQKRNAVLKLYNDKFENYILSLEEFVDLCGYFKKELNITFD